MDANTPAEQSSPGGSPTSPTSPISPISPIQDTVRLPHPEPAPPSAPDLAPPPARPKGPNAAPVVLGLVAVILAALIIATETTSLRVDWSELGPGAVVGIGIVLVVLGAVGLVRRRDDG